MITGCESLRQLCSEWYKLPLKPLDFAQQDLPAALVEYYQTMGALFAGDNDFASLSSGQDTITTPDECEVVEGRITIVRENQDCWSVLVEANPENADPEVCADAQDMLGEAVGFTSVREKLSHVLITITLQEVVMSSGYLISSEAAEPTELFDEPLEHLWGPGRVAYPEDTHRFWINADRSVLVMSYADQLWAARKSESVVFKLKPGVDYLPIN